MLALILTSALVCAVCGGSGWILHVEPVAQSYLYLAAALAATVLLGSFEAYDAQSDRAEEG